MNAIAEDRVQETKTESFFLEFIEEQKAAVATDMKRAEENKELTQAARETLLSQGKEFIALADKYEEYYVNRDDEVPDKDVISAFRRECGYNGGEGSSVPANDEENAVICLDRDHCGSCGEGYVYASDESTLFCPRCGYSTMYIDAD